MILEKVGCFYLDRQRGGCVKDAKGLGSDNMGHWTQARVGGGPWRRVWITDEQEERMKQGSKKLEEVIASAYKRFRAAEEDRSKS